MTSTFLLGSCDLSPFLMLAFGLAVIGFSWINLIIIHQTQSLTQLMAIVCLETIFLYIMYIHHMPITCRTCIPWLGQKHQTFWGDKPWNRIEGRLGYEKDMLVPKRVPSLKLTNPLKIDPGKGGSYWKPSFFGAM